MTLPAGIRVAWREVPAGTERRVVSRALLAELLPGARFVSRCPACGGDHGRVRTEGADAAVSVSYAPGWAVVVVARDHDRVGVDAVPADAAGLGRVLPRGGGARDWARVEAVLKADGRGLLVDPACVDVRTVHPTVGAGCAAGSGRETAGAAGAAGSEPEPGRAVWAEWWARIREAGADDTPLSAADAVWWGWDVEGPDGVVAAMALGGVRVESRP